MTIDERNELAEWFFSKKIAAQGETWVRFSTGEKIIFAPDVDYNLLEAMKDRLRKEAELDYITMHYPKHPIGEENTVRITLHKLVTRMGSTYTSTAGGFNEAEAFIQALLNYIRSHALL